jgi:hypothetical protein
VFSVRSVPRRYEHDKSVGELEDCWSPVVVSCCCEELVPEAENTEEWERPPLKAATRQRLVKTVTENISLCVTDL